MNPEVEEVSVEEGRRIFRQACWDHLKVSAEDFLYCNLLGSYPGDWSHEGIAAVEILLPFWTPEP